LENEKLFNRDEIKFIQYGIKVLMREDRKSWVDLNMFTMRKRTRERRRKQNGKNRLIMPWKAE